MHKTGVSPRHAGARSSRSGGWTVSRWMGSILFGAGRGRVGLLGGANGHLAVFVFVKILDQTLDAQIDPFEMVRGQSASFGVDDGEPQAFQRHVIVIRRQRQLLQQDLGMVMHLVWVARQHSLIEAFHRCERRTIAQQHVEKLQPRHMPPKHHEAERQRRGKDQPDRPP